MLFVLLFILGLCVGSFLNVLIARIPKGEDVVWKRSHCDHCRHLLHWYELIPLLSFLLQRGKTRCCQKNLSLMHVGIELGTAVGFVILFLMVSDPLLYSLSVIIYASLLVVFFIDLYHEVIAVELVGVATGASVLLHIFQGVSPLGHLVYLFSGLGCGLFFFLFWFFSKGKAMGDGDIYIGAYIGYALGYPLSIIALYIAFLTGALVGVILIVRRKKSVHAHIPFAPLLIIGMGGALVWGEQILQLWRMFV